LKTMGDMLHNRKVQRNLMLHGALVLLGTFFQGFWLATIQTSDAVNTEKFTQAIAGHRTGLAVCFWTFCVAVSLKHLALSNARISLMASLLKGLGWLLYFYNLWCTYLGRIPGRVPVEIHDNWQYNFTIVVGILIPFWTLAVAGLWVYGLFNKTDEGKRRTL